jgi:hypothetical protein
MYNVGEFIVFQTCTGLTVLRINVYQCRLVVVGSETSFPLSAVPRDFTCKVINDKLECLVLYAKEIGLLSNMKMRVIPIENYAASFAGILYGRFARDLLVWSATSVYLLDARVSRA